MAEHLWTVLCERTLADTQTHVLSLIDIIESLSSEGLEERVEAAHREGKKGAILNTRVQLVSWWYRTNPEEKALQARFVLRAPSGAVVLEAPAAMEWAEGASSIRLFVNLEKIPVAEFGLHWFFVQRPRVLKRGTRWDTVTKIPMSIDKV